MNLLNSCVVSLCILFGYFDICYAARCEMQTFKLGDVDSCVGVIQEAVRSDRDKSFGPNTHDAVVQYQRSNCNLLADGVVGSETWSQIQLHGDCKKWADTTPCIPKSILLPCLKEASQHTYKIDRNFEQPKWYMRFVENYHKDADFCVRSRKGQPWSVSGRDDMGRVVVRKYYVGTQCCYKDDLMLEAPPNFSAGSADLYRSNTLENTWMHKLYDVDPFAQCCHQSQQCRVYFRYRPSAPTR